jgi:hypothetical protein
MGLILSLTLASAIGTLLGNLGVFWAIGTMAKRKEKEQKEEFLKIHNEFLELRRKEVERMERYAKLEG